MMGSKEGSATQPPSLRSRRHIQSPAKQDEPAGQRGDQREPLTSQEDFTPKQEAAGEGCGHQEDASEDPEPPLGGIVAVEAHEADGDHADSLRHEDPSELDHGHHRDGNRREAGEDDTDDDGAAPVRRPSRICAERLGITRPTERQRVAVATKPMAAQGAQRTGNKIQRAWYPLLVPGKPTRIPSRAWLMKIAGATMPQIIQVRPLARRA